MPRSSRVVLVEDGDDGVGAVPHVDGLLRGAKEVLLALGLWAGKS